MTFTRLLPPGASFVFNDTGDPQQIFVATKGQEIDIAIGAAAAPDTSLNPTVKAVRTISIARASITGDGGEQLAAIEGITVGDANNQVQAVGVYGGASDSGTSAGNPSPDACGVYGIGNITGAGVGVGIGAFFSGSRDTNTGKASALQINVRNNTVTAGTYNSAGFSDTTGLWVTVSGQANAGVGISFGNPNGRQYDVGIAFTSQGAGGPIVTTSIRDDSSSATSILINGTHATAAIAIAAAAGTLVVGGTTVQTASNLFAVISAGNTDPLVNFGNTAANHFISVRVINSSGSGRWFVSHGAADGLSDTIAGDTGYIVATAAKSWRIGGTSTVIQVTNGNALGHFNVAPITQYNTTGTATGFTAGAGTTVTHLSTFTGNTGATAYTIGDIVRALKLYGLVAA